MIIVEEENFGQTEDFLLNELDQKKNFNILKKQGRQESSELVLFVEDKADSSKKFSIKAESIINIDTKVIDQDLLKQCQQKANIIRNCKHKNIVEIHSDYKIGFCHITQMNLFECSLGDWISRNSNQIRDNIFLDYVNQLIDGIEYLHNKNIILGNLSVRNILLTYDGVLQLFDFGIQSKYASNNFKSIIPDVQNSNTEFLYYPPELQEEINEGKEQIKQTEKADIWALGICLSLFGGAKYSNQFQNILLLSNSECLYLSNKANKIVNFILNINPLQRPNIHQIRQKVCELFMLNKVERPLEKQSELIENENQIQLQNSFERLIDFNSKNIEIISSQYYQQVKINPDNIDILITLGFFEVNYQSNFSEAKNYFQKALELNKNEIDAYLGLCWIIIKESVYKQFSKAFNYIDICLSIRSQYWRIYYMKFLLLYISDKNDEAQKVLEIGLGLKSDSIQLQSLRIYSLLYMKDYQKSQELAQNLIQQNIDNDINIFQTIGYYFLYIRKNDEDRMQAIYYYKQVLKYNTKNLIVLLNISKCYNQLGQQEESNKYIQKAKVFHPQHPLLLLQIGIFEKDENKKINLFEQSIKYDGQNKMTYYRLAELLEKQKKFDEAIQNYKKVLQFKPGDLKSLIRIGLILKTNQKQYSQSIQFLQKAMNIDSWDISTLYNISENYYFLKDFKTCKYYLELCLEINPKFYQAYFGQGLLSESEQRYDVSFEFYKKALSIQPNDFQSIKAISILLSNKKQEHQKAIQYLKIGIKLFPQNAELLDIAASIYFDLKDYEKAMKYCKLSIQKDENYQNPKHGLIVIKSVI